MAQTILTAEEIWQLQDPRCRRANLLTIHRRLGRTDGTRGYLSRRHLLVGLYKAWSEQQDGVVLPIGLAERGQPYVAFHPRERRLFLGPVLPGTTRDQLRQVATAHQISCSGSIDSIRRVLRSHHYRMLVDAEDGPSSSEEGGPMVVGDDGSSSCDEEDHEMCSTDPALVETLLIAGYRTATISEMSLVRAREIQEFLKQVQVSPGRGECKYNEGTLDPWCDGRTGTISLATIPQANGFCMSHHCYDLQSIAQLVARSSVPLNPITRKPLTETEIRWGGVG